jgi:hypothetical protein
MGKTKCGMRDKLFLESVDFVWDMPEFHWVTRKEALQLYYDQHGHTRVPHNYKLVQDKYPELPTHLHNYKLGMVVSNIRSAVTTVSPNFLEFLGSVKFVWDMSKFEWRTRKEALQLYYDHHDHTRVPSKYTLTKEEYPQLPSHLNNYKLGLIVGNIRQRKKNISPEFLLFLDSVDFVWDMVVFDRVTRKEALQLYYDRHGHTRVPYKYTLTKEEYPKLPPHLNNYKLGSLITRIRSGVTTLSSKFLDSMDFVWDMKEFKWRTPREALQFYYDHHGHTRVPQKYKLVREEYPQLPTHLNNYKLGSLVSRIRNRKKKYSEVMTFLDSVDFTWDASKKRKCRQCTK